MTKLLWRIDTVVLWETIEKMTGFKIEMVNNCVGFSPVFVSLEDAEKWNKDRFFIADIVVGDEEM